MEVTVTGANALTYPVLNIWNWVVSLYLFLIGAAAGLMVMSALACFRRRDPLPGQCKDSIAAAGLSPILLLLGMSVMFLELEARSNSYWLLLSFSFSSRIFWGAWGMSFAFLFSVLYFLSLMTDENRERIPFSILKVLSCRLAAHTRTLAGISCTLGIFTALYSGTALSGFVARPFWNMITAPLLFLVSSMTTGAAVFIILSREKPMRLLFTKILTWLIGTEIAAILLFLLEQLFSSSPRGPAMAALFPFDRDYLLIAACFMLIGICLPLMLILRFRGVDERCGEELTRTAVMRMKLSAILTISGGLIIRLWWVHFGQLSKLS